MSFSILTNVASLQAQNYLRINSNFQMSTINQVTSGLRITKSGDDAAGLAIANGYRSDQAVLTQGVQNASDGQSQLQIMDGGMSNISQLLDRASTLATQSATGTFTGDRNVLNTEFQSVLGEIDRQAQSIGLNTGGLFAQNLSVFMGGGTKSGSISAVQNGSVSVNLSSSTVDSQSLGLKGVQVSGAAGTDIGAGSGLTSLSSILANTTNSSSETTPNSTTFYLKGPGFDSQGVAISVNTKNIGGTSDLVSAINSAIQAAANGGTQQGTALKNANITASVNTDSAGRQQLTFNSSVAAFQVQAGDQMANALMGNFEPLNAAATGTDTQSTLNTTGHGTIAFQFDGGSGTVTVNTVPTATGTTKTAIMDALNGDANFHAAATASLNGNQLVITSKTSTSSSAVKVVDGGAGSLSRMLGLTTNGDSTTAASSPSTGAALTTSVMGSAVTGTGATQFTAANAGNITVRFTGAGLTSPVDVTVAASAGETLSSVVNDLNTQVTANSSLKAAGISLNSAYNNLDGNHQLQFTSNSGQAFNVAVTGDTTNQLGFGSFQGGNTVSGNAGAFDYTTLTGASYSPGTTGTQGLTAGTASLQFSINGQASNTNNIAVDLTSLPNAAAATVTGSQSIANPVTINAAGAVPASYEVSSPVAATATIGSNAAASLTIGSGNAGITFSAVTPGAGGDAYSVVFTSSANSTLGANLAGNVLTVTLAASAGNVVTSTASDVNTLINGAGNWSSAISSSLVGDGSGLTVTHGSANLTGGDPQLTFTASTPGVTGNDITVKFQHSGNSSPLSYAVQGNGNIVVNLATNSSGAITSTASDIVGLLNGQAGVNVALAPGAVGTDAVTNVGQTSLAGGGDAGLTFTSKRTGTAGNSDTIALVNAGNSQSLGVTVTGTAAAGYHFSVNLATDSSGNITSTASDVAGLLNSDGTSSPLISAGTVGGGSNIVSALTQTNLANGEDAGANDNNQLNLTVSGHAYNVVLSAGSNVTLNSIADQINSTSTFSTYGTATVQNNQLVIKSALKGAGASVQVEAGSANSLLGLTTGTTYGTSATGTDVASYLNQQFAANQVLQQAGLQASFTGGQLTIGSNNGTNFRLNEVGTTAATSAQATGSAAFGSQATSAVVQGGNGGVNGAGGTFTFTAAQTLSYTVGGTGQTVNFGIGSYSKQQVLDAINSQSTLATASWDSATGNIQLVANATGAATKIVVGNNTTSTANGILGFDPGATAQGVNAVTTAAISGSNDTLNLAINGTALAPITLTHGLTQATSDVATDLNTVFDNVANPIAAHASVDAQGHLQIASTTTGVSSSVQILAGTANSVLGLSTGTTQGTDTNIGFGASGASFTGNTSSGAPVASAQVDAGGASQTSDIAFTPVLYGSDAQTVTIAANNSNGAQQSLSVVLQNSGSNRSGRSIDEAVSAINTQLQQSNNATLQQIVAVKDNTGGTEQIKFMSNLGSFQVSVGSNGGVDGLGSATPGTQTTPPQQGTTFASAVAGGGSSADISNQSSAEAAVTALGKAVTLLGSAQAAVGKGENLFTYATNLAQSQLTNLATAESGIRDANLAQQAANLTKAQILMQAGVAALAQANSAPQQILTLLRGQ